MNDKTLLPGECFRCQQPMSLLHAKLTETKSGGDKGIHVHVQEKRKCRSCFATQEVIATYIKYEPKESPPEEPKSPAHPDVGF